MEQGIGRQPVNFLDHGLWPISCAHAGLSRLRSERDIKSPIIAPSASNGIVGQSVERSPLVGEVLGSIPARVFFFSKLSFLHNFVKQYDVGLNVGFEFSFRI